MNTRIEVKSALDSKSTSMRVVTECAVRTIENITTSYASRNNRLALEYARLNTARFELLLQESKSVESILLKEQS